MDTGDRDGGDRDRWLAARELAILQELHSRTPDIVCGADSAAEALAGDPDARGVGDAPEGEDPGEGLLGARRVAQDDVGGAASDRL